MRKINCTGTNDDLKIIKNVFLGESLCLSKKVALGERKTKLKTGREK